MKNYNKKHTVLQKEKILLTGEDGRRFKKLGDFGERLAPEVLKRNGFDEIEDLNKIIMNFPFADFSAKRGGTKYIISVKSRNKYEHGGNLNSRYKLGDTEKKLNKIRTEAKYSEYKCHVSAWLAISFEEKTFDAYFGTIEQLENKRGIPMSEKNLLKYERFAERENHDFDSAEFKNVYKPK